MFGLLIGCGSAPVFKVETVPEKAEVVIVAKADAAPKVIGEAPFEKEEKELKKAVGKLNPKDGFVELRVRKQGYRTKSLWVPVTSSGSLRSTLKVTLEKDEAGIANFETVEEILDQMFLAQKFARLKQYERALIEIDRVLKKFPDFARALTLQGSIYFANGDFKNSLSSYEKALQADPKFDHALEMVSKVRKQLKLPPRAPASVRGGRK